MSAAGQVEGAGGNPRRSPERGFGGGKVTGRWRPGGGSRAE